MWKTGEVQRYESNSAIIVTTCDYNMHILVPLQDISGLDDRRVLALHLPQLVAHLQVIHDDLGLQTPYPGLCLCLTQMSHPIKDPYILMYIKFHSMQGLGMTRTGFRGTDRVN